jgi:hypothetical protein
MVGWLVNDELKMIWNEEIVVSVKYCHSIWVEELRKTKKHLRTAGVAAEIQTEHLQAKLN